MNVYIIRSLSYRLINQEINKIVKNIPNVVRMSYKESSLTDIMEEVGYTGFFDEQKAVIVSDFSMFATKKDHDEERLIPFLNSLTDANVLILIANDLVKTKALTKEVLKIAKFIDYANLGDEDILKLVKDYLKEININIEDDVLKYLIKRCNNEVDIIFNEIDKLVLLDDKITKDVVDTYSVNMDSYEDFAFSNALVNKNFKSAFDILETMLNNGVLVYSIIGQIADAYTNMFMVKDALNYGLSDQEIATSLGYNKVGRVIVMKKNSSRYSIEELKDIINELALLDKKIKTGYDPVYELKSFIINL